MRARGALVGVLLLALVAAGTVSRSDTAEMATTPAAPVAAQNGTVTPSSPTPATSDPASPAADDLDLDLDAPVIGPEAVDALGDDLAAVAAVNELTTPELVEALQDPTYGVGASGRLFVAEFIDEEHARDHDEAAAPAAPGDEPVALAAVAPLSQTFELNSLPGSNRTIYLDFDGHTLSGTIWNTDQGIPDGRTVPAFSLDGSADFSTTELEYIQNVWSAVAEDYAPFDVNVTTQAPGADTLNRSSPSDQTYGARAIITTPAVQADFPSSCPLTSTCAGLAYVGVFDVPGFQHARYQGAFVNAAGVTNPLTLTTIISHEVGHNGGLNHAGLGNQAYYSGTGNWGPIMGTPYGRALSQWTQHSYTGANNGNGGDLAILASTGIAPRADDAGATIATSAASGWTTSRRGLISTPTDQDMWSLGRCDGTVTVSATPSTYSTNLDISLSLVTGTAVAPAVLATADPASGQNGNGPLLRATGVAAQLQRTAGDTPYYVLVQGSSSGPDGGYGNLGPYTLSAVCDGVTAPPAGQAKFTDVPNGSPFFTEITWLAGQGISTGYENGNGTKRYEPSAAVLREQMAAFLYRFDHDGANPPVTGAGSGFLDVPIQHPFAEHIRWLSTSGVTTGYSDGTFRPSQPVLREQMAAFLYRLEGATATARTCGLVDVPASHSFAREICWLKSTGITTGYATPSGTQFRGGQPVLREQMAAFLYRFDRLP